MPEGGAGCIERDRQVGRLEDREHAEQGAREAIDRRRHLACLADAELDRLRTGASLEDHERAIDQAVTIDEHDAGLLVGHPLIIRRA